MAPAARAAPADGSASTHRLTAFVTAYRRRRFAWLFVSLLLTLGAGPTLEALAPRYSPLQLLLAISLLAAIASVAHEGEMRLPLLLGLGFVVARLARAALGMPGILAVSELLFLTATVLVTVATVRHALLRPGAVDSERILAALDAYLLAGLLFGVAYWTLDKLWPASFGGSPSGGLDLSGAIYFSFVTIATLGYGDVIPASEPARGLSIVEGVSGQMYLAVLVARLVSLYSRERDV
jgi:hypothetical protein